MHFETNALIAPNEAAAHNLLPHSVPGVNQLNRQGIMSVLKVWIFVSFLMPVDDSHIFCSIVLQYVFGALFAFIGQDS